MGYWVPLTLYGCHYCICHKILSEKMVSHFIFSLNHFQVSNWPPPYGDHGVFRGPIRGPELQMEATIGFAIKF